MNRRRRGPIIGLLVLVIHLITFVLVLAVLAVRIVWTVVATEVRHHRAARS